MKNNNLIALIGYMGSGKSTVGKLLAEKLNYDFIDLDEYIEEKVGMTISEIFEQKGQVWFRKQEHLYLLDVLQMENTVLSLGGGTPCYYDNMKFINSKTKSFYLQFTPNVLAERLSKEKDTRPMIKHLNEPEVAEFVAKHLFERNEFYIQSDFIIQGKELLPMDIIKVIVRKLEKAQPDY